MSTIPYRLKFNCMGEWARQQSLFKLCRVRLSRVKESSNPPTPNFLVFLRRLKKIKRS